MSPDTLTVGIALAAYRPNIEYFAEQLATIASQSESKFRCVVTFDSPIAEIRSEPTLASYFLDPRFEWIENSPRLGTAKNFEAGIRHLTVGGSELIFCSDQDDVWYPTKIAAVRAEFIKRGAGGSGALVHCDLHRLTAHGTDGQTVWEQARFVTADVRPHQILIRNVVFGCAMALDAKLAKKYGVIPAEFPLHDIWFAYVAAKHGGVWPLSQPLIGYRQHANNQIGSTSLQGPMALPAGEGLSGTLHLCRAKAKRTRQMFEAAQRCGLKPSLIESILFFKYDLGLSLFVYGALKAFSNVGLARAAWAIAVGKMFSSVARK